MVIWLLLIRAIRAKRDQTKSGSSRRLRREAEHVVVSGFAVRSGKKQEPFMVLFLVTAGSCCFNPTPEQNRSFKHSWLRAFKLPLAFFLFATVVEQRRKLAYITRKAFKKKKTRFIFFFTGRNRSVALSHQIGPWLFCGVSCSARDCCLNPFLSSTTLRRSKLP
jgi:hypothetical protein